MILEDLRGRELSRRSCPARRKGVGNGDEPGVLPVPQGGKVIVPGEAAEAGESDPERSLRHGRYAARAKARPVRTQR